MEPEALIGQPVRDPAGQPLGLIEEVFVNRKTGAPQFVAVDAGRPGQLTPIPMEGGTVDDGGAGVRVAFEAQQVASAPTLTVGGGFPPDDEVAVLTHFRGESPTRIMDVPGVPMASDGESAEVVLHEEQATVARTRLATERVRVRKRIVTEPVTLTVELRREELVIEREPLDGVGTGEPGDGDRQLEEGELTFVLHAEEPVVHKRVVPIERVRVAKDAVVEEQEVLAEVRREQIDVQTEELRP